MIDPSISIPNVFSALQKQEKWPYCSNTFGGDCKQNIIYYTCKTNIAHTRMIFTPNNKH